MGHPPTREDFHAHREPVPEPYRPATAPMARSLGYVATSSFLAAHPFPAEHYADVTAVGGGISTKAFCKPRPGARLRGSCYAHAVGAFVTPCSPSGCSLSFPTTTRLSPKPQPKLTETAAPLGCCDHGGVCGASLSKFYTPHWFLRRRVSQPSGVYHPEYAPPELSSHHRNGDVSIPPRVIHSPALPNQCMIRHCGTVQYLCGFHGWRRGWSRISWKWILEVCPRTPPRRRSYWLVTG